MLSVISSNVTKIMFLLIKKENYFYTNFVRQFDMNYILHVYIAVIILSL